VPGGALRRCRLGSRSNNPGLTLAYAILVGLGTLLGTVVPSSFNIGKQVDKALLIEIVAGIAVMLIGTTLSAWPDISESTVRNVVQPRRGDRTKRPCSRRYYVASLAPMLNYSFAFGQDIAWSGLSSCDPLDGRVFAVRNECNLGRFGTSIGWGLFQIFMILTATPGQRLHWRAEICPAFGSNSPGLEHHLSQRRDAAFGIRKSNETSLDKSVD
jgi:hypothetical protein